MKNKDDKINKMLLDILKDVQTLKAKLHSDFIKLDLALIEEKIKKLLK